ncbi:unnamed protein product [Oppiella nova]|uniref:Uncharacterized protein n=1 Tax=Oppiella nova TaxID=334625 RepID=A0A7R9M9T2_9ACAR|nr:unnamed protein product [Oppiella nova]CAG2172129.1 unnamed protein product [Oppiella nova]
MFGSKSKAVSSPSRVSIEEANSHLRAVHQRVEQLEQIITTQRHQLVANEDTHRQEVQCLVQTHDKHVQHLNQQMDSLKDKIQDLEHKLEKQNYKLIEENAKQMEKLSQILKLTPNLEKLLKLLNSLMINNTNCVKTVDLRSATSHDLMNGFGDNSPLEDIPNPHNNHSNSSHKIAVNTGEKAPKKSVKLNCEDQCIPEEVFLSETSSTNTSIGRSPPSSTTSSAATGLTVMATGAAGNGGSGSGAHNHHHKRSSNSKLRIGRSFNITANFSDDEEQPVGRAVDRTTHSSTSAVNTRPGMPRKKSTDI